MNLAISIKADQHVIQELHARLAHLAAGQYAEDPPDRDEKGRISLTLSVETIDPDSLLREISTIIAGIEKCTPFADSIEIQVRNTLYSEPVLSISGYTKPFAPAGNIRIVPWHDLKTRPAAADDIFLTPATAFGTGLHPSTKLCLQLLTTTGAACPGNNHEPCSVLDVGCGSGILTIAALRLGAAKALGIEIDPEAVKTARRNIYLNRLEHRAVIRECSWQKISTTHDLILANLVPSVLFKAAPFLAKLLSKRGVLITAGFRAASTDKVHSLFTGSGLHLVQKAAAEGWGAMLLSCF